MDFSVIIAAFERPASLERLLASIERHFAGAGVSYEVIVANNARDRSVSERIDAVVREFSGRDGRVFRAVREPAPGKCRAQNRAIADAGGSILAFFDDDVEVTAEWLPAATEFFRDTDFDAMQGPILVPPEVAGNAEFQRSYQRFRTIDFLQYPSETREIDTLTGANMAIRREAFARCGLFNEALGPGRSGISEDVEFAGRLIACGGRIGYEPRAAVYHEVDWNRFTEAFFRKRHEQQGVSRFLYKRQSLAAIIGNMLRSVMAFGWYALWRNERRQYRAKGRYFHYRAMLREKMKALRVGPAGG
ncbi:MAG TPA: glycosyltransferase [candidate division Zixibacteria bacterium]|nr:glycosyltransferase [candidate division Zixibacteria bacterium]